MEKINCVLYARYSSNNQREISAEEQIRYCREFANEMGFEVVAEYIDKALTGTSANRREFQRMIEDSQKRYFRYVIVYANNRFARNRYDKQHYKRELQKNGVDILYSSQAILNGDSPDSILFESLDDGISEWYSRNLAVEVMKKGHLPNAEKCLHNGGIPPFGFDIVNQKLVKNKEEAKVVELIFDWYVNRGWGYTKIAQKLNEMGAKNKVGTSFKSANIRDMFFNEKYIGTYIYNRRTSYDSMGRRNNSKWKDDSEIIRIQHAFEGIVSEETFQKAQEIMKNKRGRNATNQAKEVYLLSGIIKCGKCGRNMHGNRKPTNRNGSYHITYKCNNRDKNGTKICSNKEINKIYIERAVMHYIANMCEGDNFKMIMKALKQYAKEQSDGNAELHLLESKLNKINRQIDNIVNAIAKGFDFEELQEKYTALKEDKGKVSDLLAVEKKKQSQEILIDENNVKKALEQISADIQTGKPLETYKKLFSSFVERVEVFEDYVNIVLKVFDMINIYVSNSCGIETKKPPLEFNQVVVWNSGPEGNRTPVRKPIP